MSIINVNSFGTFFSFLKSAFLLDDSKKYNFGSPNINEFGIGISFEKGHIENKPLLGAGFVSALANVFRNNYPFQVATNAGVHITAHELGHAGAAYALTGKCSEIAIKIDQCAGETHIPRCVTKLAGWKKTVIDVAGPMADVALCACKLMGASALRNFSSSIAPSSPATSVALSSATGVLAFGAMIWIAGELTYAFCGVVNRNEVDDFKKIADRGKIHLAVASLALVTECALALAIFC
ncbi:MAG: hypothetical protein WA347_09090 [Rhabdochlamydiaceae bacterium]|jgi:hypothetical protein